MPNAIILAAEKSSRSASFTYEKKKGFFSVKGEMKNTTVYLNKSHVEKRRIKILHFELDKNIGGIESFLYNIYRQIDKSMFQFDFVTRYDSPAWENELKQLGANIYKVRQYNNLFHYMNDIDEILKKGYDIVHVHKNSAANILPFYVFLKYPYLKVVVHSHNTSPSVGGVSKFLHYMNRSLLWNFADSHLACSNLAGEWLYGKGKKYDVIRNGVETQRYLFSKDNYRLIRKEFNIPDGAYVIGHIGRFTEQKNQRYLIDLFNIICRKKENAYLVFIGDGILKEGCETYVKELGISTKVRFLGVRNDVPILLQAIDTLVMPSLYEGLPIVAIEAQAAGVNLFLSDTISSEVQITENVGWFSLTDNKENIANELLKINLLSVAERQIMNIKVIASGYDTNDTVSFLSSFYLTLCKDSKFMK